MSYMLVSAYKNVQMWEKLDRDVVQESNDVKLVGNTLKNKLKVKTCI